MIQLPLLLVLLWPFYQFSEFPALLPFRIYALDLLVFAVATQNLRYLRPNLLAKPLFAFLFAWAISLAFSQTLSLSGFLYPARLLLYCFLIFTPGITRKQVALSFIFLVITGLVQYVFLPDLRFLKASGFDDHLYRLSFPFLDPNYTAAAISFSFLFLLQFSYRRFLILPFILALALTFSRAGYLAFTIGLISLNRRFLFLIPLLALLVFLSPKPFGEGVNLARTFSITSRLENFRTAGEMFLQNPILGVGTSPKISNSYLYVLTTTGLVGFSCFVYFLISLLKYLRFDPYLFSAFISLLIHSLFNNTLFYAPIMIMVILTIAISKVKT